MFFNQNILNIDDVSIVNPIASQPTHVEKFVIGSYKFHIFLHVLKIYNVFSYHQK